jgi:hypothetical protein
MAPKIKHIDQDDTHRLIPDRFFGGESVLSRLGLPPAQMAHLYQLDDATNDRLAGEANLLPGISVHELVFGVPHFHIINASFTHAQPNGSRFSGSDRGVWYAGFSLKTAQSEVAFHYAAGLREIKWEEEETVVYRVFLSDFHGEFQDLRNDPASKKYLRVESYRDSQKLGRRLLNQGSAGIVYPSVRHAGGTCIACFRPALVSNVREGGKVAFTFSDASHPPKVRLTS